MRTMIIGTIGAGFFSLGSVFLASAIENKTFVYSVSMTGYIFACIGIGLFLLYKAIGNK